jgi:hypothetical protein
MKTERAEDRVLILGLDFRSQRTPQRRCYMGEVIMFVLATLITLALLTVLIQQIKR